MRTLVKIKDFDKMQKKSSLSFQAVYLFFLGRKNTVSEAKYMATKFSYKF